MSAATNHNIDRRSSYWRSYTVVCRNRVLVLDVVIAGKVVSLCRSG